MPERAIRHGDKPSAPPQQVSERPITEAEIRSFLTGKRLAGCAVCSHYDWRIRDDTTALACGCTSGDTASANVGIVMLVCQNCGALEFHDRTVIARWLDCHRRS